MTKVTKMDNFTAIVDVLKGVGRTDLVEVMEHEMELLAKKNSYKSTKPTATQKANAEIKANIFGQMESGKAYTITEIIKTFSGCGELSNQRVSALVNQMVDEGKVVKTVDKRKSYFSLA